MSEPARYAGELAMIFADSLARMGGEYLDGGREALARAVAAKAGTEALVCSAVPEWTGNCEPDGRRPAGLADIELGIVRASFGVAETGSVCLTDGDLSVNALGYLPQSLIVLLDPADIVADLHAAYERSEWRERRYAVLQSGPSATADIEGVLIRGAQGVRALSVIALQRSTGASSPER